jgi:hypothetical protein
MNGLIEAASEIQGYLDGQGWKSCIIGGLANLYWGKSRVTRDVDITLIAGWGNEMDYIGRILETYPSRVNNAQEFALENRVLLLFGAGDIPVDLSLGALPFEKAAVARAHVVQMGSISLRICSAEDLIVMKAFANRDQDWADISGILTCRRDSLEKRYILDQIIPLAEIKPGEGILEKLESMFD